MTNSAASAANTGLSNSASDSDLTFDQIARHTLGLPDPVLPKNSPSAEVDQMDSAALILPEMGITQLRKTRSSVAKGDIKLNRAVLDLQERARAVCHTLHDLQGMGLDLPPPDETDEEIAERLVLDYAEDPYGTSKDVSNGRELHGDVGAVTPASLVLVSQALDTFGTLVVKDASKIRHYVTNKLLEEVETAKDARIRLRSLELLGKISDVALFTEKKHVTFEDVSGDEMRGKLKSKLEQLRERAVDAEYSRIPDTD